MAASVLPPLQLGQRPRCFLKELCSLGHSSGLPTSATVAREGQDGSLRQRSESVQSRRVGEALALLQPWVTHAALLLQPVVPEGGPVGVPGRHWKVSKANAR